MSPARPQILVLGPVYLDLVLEVDRPLMPVMPTAGDDASRPAARVVLDHSVYEISRSSEPAGELIVRNNAHQSIEIFSTTAAMLPVTGTITVDRQLAVAQAWRHRIGLAAHRILPGGMGAGFAAALKSRVVAALGANDSQEPDADGQQLIERLRDAAVRLNPQLIQDVKTDTTVLLSSGPHGDKLPVGRRRAAGSLRCDAELSDTIRQSDVLVIAGHENQLTAELLQAAGKDCVIVFAPTWRNIDPTTSELVAVLDRIDYISCNEEEWRGLDGDSWLRQQVALITVTAGTKGATVHFRNQAGEPGSLHVPAYRAADRPVDTNRGGESFASAFLNCLLEEIGIDGLKSRRFTREIIEQAAREATVAAYLQVQTSSFRFHDRHRIRAEMSQY